MYNKQINEFIFEEPIKSDNEDSSKNQNHEALFKLLKCVKHEARVGKNYQCPIPNLLEQTQRTHTLVNYIQFGFKEVYLAHRMQPQ